MITPRAGMCKSAFRQTPRQAGLSHSAVLPPLGPTFLTPDCAYSVINGLLYDHLAAAYWRPEDPLLLSFEVDYRPLVRNLRAARVLLRRELGQTISPRRKRQIRNMRAGLEAALFWFEFWADAGNDDAGGAG